MAPEVAAAVIAGVFGLVSPVVTYIAIKQYDNGVFQRHSERLRALVGKWQGTMHQEVGPEGTPFDAPYTLQLTVSGKVVSGTGSSHPTFWGKEYDARFLVRGGFLHERFLRFDFHNADEAIIQFGSMTLALSDDCESLKGRYVGYGDVSKQIVYGTIDLHKPRVT